MNVANASKAVVAPAYPQCREVGRFCRSRAVDLGYIVGRNVPGTDTHQSLPLDGRCVVDSVRVELEHILKATDFQPLVKCFDHVACVYGACSLPPS